MAKNKKTSGKSSPVHKATISNPGADAILEQERFRLTLFDYIVAPAIALFAAVWVFRYIGTTINWDDLLYMNMNI